MTRMRRKNGSLWCKVIHRLCGWWHDGVNKRAGWTQRVAMCGRCGAWYPRGPREAAQAPQEAQRVGAE